MPTSKPVGPTPAPSFKTIPKGYTFLNATTFASRSTVDLLAKYLDKVADQYPEDDNPAGMWKMMNGESLCPLYILPEPRLTECNVDSDAYVILDLIDEQLSAVHGKMLKKLWDEAYAHIHALTLFMDSEDHWQSTYFLVTIPPDVKFDAYFRCGRWRTC